MKKHYSEIVTACDNGTERVLNTIRDNMIISYDDLMFHPGAQLGSVLTLAPSYYCSDSRFYKNEEVLDVMLRLTETMKKMQHDDGTFDLLISNFHSAPDTGFIMHNTVRTYRVMEHRAVTEKEVFLKNEIYELIRTSAKGLCEGGFHTPNHRWVEAAGLAMAYNVTKETYLKDMALKYLNEGLDIDENGEWTERSPGIYNAVSDNAVIILAQELNKPELYEAVTKNMDLMFHYLDPNGAVFTQNSVRVDKGEGMPGKAFYPTNYYQIYLEMAYELKNRKYAMFADLIFNSALRNGRGVPGALWLFMQNEALKEFEIELEEIPDQYEVFYQPSKIVRKRNKNLGITILGNSSNFLFVQNNNMRCYVRMCSSFFAVAQFKPADIIKTDKGYQMTFHAHGRYLLPFDEKPETTDFMKMDHSKRGTTNHLDLDYKVDIEMLDNGVKMNVNTEGCERVPFKLEFCLSGNCTVKTDSFIIKGTPGESIVTGSESIEAFIGNDRLSIGPGFMSHFYADDMRGSEPKSRNDFTVYFTDFTNINKTVYIKAV
ncbi:MAG: hypothetical protein JXQ23_04805 [Clostridia bacterium]|nr:hypothetical protein [Clostridia bacterium]